MLRTIVPALAVLGSIWLAGCSAGNSDTPAGRGGASNGGASGSSTSGGQPNAGSGGVVASAGSSGTTAIAGGSGSGTAGSGAAGAGAGGSSGVAGSAGSGGGSAGTGSVGCSSLPLCDDFEGVAAGSPPDATKWIPSVLTGCSSTAATKPTVDGSQHHSGTRSLKVTGMANYCDYAMVGNAAAFTTIGNVVYGRYYLRFETALPMGHTGFMAFVDDSQTGKALRMGGQNLAFQWNRESDDATLPDQSPVGIGLSKAPPVGTWMCVEFMIDQAHGLINTWVDGALIAGLVSDGSSTPDVDDKWTTYRPMLKSFNIGWQNYGGGTMNLWFDDVALSATRIGCN